jgi:hypothetical protein
VGRKLVLWGGGLIAVYLVVTHGKGASRVTGAVGSNSSNVIKSLQGR